MSGINRLAASHHSIHTRSIVGQARSHSSVDVIKASEFNNGREPEASEPCNTLKQCDKREKNRRVTSVSLLNLTAWVHRMKKMKKPAFSGHSFLQARLLFPLGTALLCLEKIDEAASKSALAHFIAVDG